VFNKKSLTNLFIDAGFKSVNQWNPSEVEHHNFVDWTSKKLLINKVEYPISLNLEAYK